MSTRCTSTSCHRRAGSSNSGRSRPLASRLLADVSAWAILDKASGRYRPLDELRGLCAPLLTGDRVITYCGGGIAAASLAFVLHMLGRPNVAVYDGGLLEWCADPSLPLEMGDS